MSWLYFAQIHIQLFMEHTMLNVVRSERVILQVQLLNKSGKGEWGMPSEPPRVCMFLTPNSICSSKTMYILFLVLRLLTRKTYQIPGSATTINQKNMLLLNRFVEASSQQNYRSFPEKLKIKNK